MDTHRLILRGGERSEVLELHTASALMPSHASHTSPHINASPRLPHHRCQEEGDQARPLKQQAGKLLRVVSEGQRVGRVRRPPPSPPSDTAGACQPCRAHQLLRRALLLFLLLVLPPYFPPILTALAPPPPPPAGTLSSSSVQSSSVTTTSPAATSCAPGPTPCGRSCRYEEVWEKLGRSSSYDCVWEVWEAACT